MQNSSVICAQQLSKRYLVQSAQTRTEYQLLSERLVDIVTTPWRWLGQRVKSTSNDCFWALRDLTFDIRPGEVVGVVGRNGAGKSTLLKILSRITSPTSGFVDLWGRVGSLLEVGTGFHPELTGRENIFLNGSILGMTRHEIRRHYDAIVEFSGVARFLEMPVKRYSSGMRVRLAFAVAAHLDPDVLVVDEVLAVGDLAFQQKCMQRMGEVASDGRTILFVSHNMAAIEALCERSLYLSGGRLVADGPTAQVVAAFIQDSIPPCGSRNLADVALTQHAHRRTTDQQILTHLRIRNAAGQLASQFPLGNPIRFELSYVNPQQSPGWGFAVFLCAENGQRIAMLHSHIHSGLTSSNDASGTLCCELQEIPLLPGSYRIDLAVATTEDILDSIDHATTITILPSDYLGTGLLPGDRQGLVALRCQWMREPPQHVLPALPCSSLNGEIASSPPTGATIEPWV